MKKKNDDLFENPEDMEESDLKDTTLASHMSFLTNKRLHELFEEADIAGRTAGTTFGVEVIMAYAAALDAIYKVIECILTDQQRMEIISIFERYYAILFKENKVIKERYEMYQMLSTIHRLINSYLQRFQYFFRLEAIPLKGIRNTLIKMGWVDDNGEVPRLDEK